MEAILKESQRKLPTTEFEMLNDGNHSTKAIILAHAVPEGLFSDADYLATTFPVMVHLPGFPNQPVILCLADTLAEIKRACMRAFGWDENFPVGVEVKWAYNNQPGDERTLGMSESNVRATLRILKARAGLDSLNMVPNPHEVLGR